ncbi:MAG: cation diffusion facilitator family transporter [Candidatus Odinarchaeia archaeon]
MDNYKKVRRLLIIILFFNLAVLISKGIVGVYSNTLSMVADAFHSLLDSSGNVIGLLGIYFAQKTPDRDHPYGHSKFEQLGAILISFMLLITGFEVIRGAVERLMNPVIPSITILNWIVMGVAIAINIGVSHFERKKGLEYKNDILLSDSEHTKSDVFVSFSVIIGFIFILLGLIIFDIIISIFIAIFIFYLGFKLFRNISKTLIDTIVIPPEEIEAVVLSIEGVKDVHKIRSRGSQNDCFLDLHFTVEPNLPIKNGHELSKIIEQKLKEKFPHIKEVITHIEPAE